MTSFTTTKGSLGNALAAVDVDLRRNNHPLMRCVLIDTRDGVLRLTTGDYETFAFTRVDNATVNDHGMVAMNHEALSKLLPALTKGMKTKKEANEAPVTVRTGDDGRQALVELAGYTMPLETAPAEEYPTPPETPPAVATVQLAEFTQGVGRALTAVANDDIIQTLTNVATVVRDGHVDIVGNDRYRVAVSTLPAETTGDQRTLLIPSSTMKLMKNHASGSLLNIGASPQGEGAGDFEYARLTSGNLTLITRTGDGDYPPYEGLFPEGSSITVRVDKSTLTAAVDKAQAALKAATGEKKPMGRLRVEPEGMVSLAPKAKDASAPGHPASVTGMSEPGSWLFNLSYLKDAVGTVDTSDVVLHLTEELTSTGGPKPVLMQPSEGDSYRHLVMPARDS